jgi:hypothetical protein
MTQIVKAYVIEDYGQEGQVQLDRTDGATAFVFWTGSGWTLADEGEPDARPDTYDEFPGWERAAKKARKQARQCVRRQQKRQ